MIKSLMAAGIVAACFTAPALAQSAADGPYKPRMGRTGHEPMGGAQASRYGMGHGAQMARPGMRPFGGPHMVRPARYGDGRPFARPFHARGYGASYGFGRRHAVGAGYGYGYNTGYSGSADYGYAGNGGGYTTSYGGGYTTGYGGGYGYDQTVAGPRQVGYGVGATSGVAGYAAATQPCCAAPSSAVATTAYLPVVTYRPIRVMYTPQTPPYYNTPPYLAY